MKSYIVIENAQFYAYHGVGAQETQVGNVFLVNLKLELDLLQACESDNLNHTVSYAQIYESVRDEMNIPSKLLEHVAYRIITRLRKDFDRIATIELKLSKRNPPIGHGVQVEYAGVCLIDIRE